MTKRMVFKPRRGQKRSPVDAARLEERRSLRAAVRVREEITRLTRQLGRAIGAGDGALNELMYSLARSRGLRVLSRQEHEQIELDRLELEQLRHQLADAKDRVYELENNPRSRPAHTELSGVPEDVAGTASARY